MGSSPERCCASYLITEAPTSRSDNLGFRIVRQADDQTQTDKSVPIVAKGDAPPAPPAAGASKTDSLGMKLVPVPAGEFLMGNSHSAAEEVALFGHYQVKLNADNFKDEYPRHRVRITKPFYMGVYHITVGQFRQFVDDTSYKTDGEKSGKAWGYDAASGNRLEGPQYTWRKTGFEQSDDHPVVNVSWNDAMAFCQWLSRKTGQTYRLPTEAEWEYACRAGTTTRYASGDDPETLATVANVGDAALKVKFPTDVTIRASDGYVFTSPVGQFLPNAFGLYDMHGNAWQWCADWYADTYYASSHHRRPQRAGFRHLPHHPRRLLGQLTGPSLRRVSQPKGPRLGHDVLRLPRGPHVRRGAGCPAETESAHHAGRGVSPRAGFPASRAPGPQRPGF